ncbi:MAG: hypothetical protein NTX88_00425, partial [Candidatus Atribacteria bacterium]|nr:hypothetical protein [Candidatus Atribacteria bacterium]
MELKVSYQAKVNLLPKKYIVKKTPNWVRVFFLTIMFVATMFHLYAYSLDTQKIAFFTNSIDTLNVELNYLKEQEKKMQDVQNQITIIQKRVDIIKNLIKTEPDWLQIIQTIGKNMPD